MWDNIFDRNLAYIRSELEKECRYEHALNIVEFDCMTICPPTAQTREMETYSVIADHIFRIRNSKEFGEAVEAAYKDIDKASAHWQVLIKHLYRSYLHNKKITVQMNNDIERMKREVYFAWVDSREKNDASGYISSLEELIEARKNKYQLYERLPEEENLSTYELMLGEFEEGLTKAELEALLGSAVDGVQQLLSDINEKDLEFRTGFLGRDVIHDNQHEMARYIMDIMGFDFDRGTVTKARYPIMSIVSNDDIRLTSRDSFDNFINEIYFTIHVCGLALFEQMQPAEDAGNYIDGCKSKGMLEAVAAFYENILGKSREFIHLIYPKVCEIYPRLMRDVTETELFEAINRVEPSLNRINADEVTCMLHGLIRYELEKDLIDGDLSPAGIREAWNAKYEKYLGITPDTDKDGVLQDMHWSRDFGILPMYPLGNLYAGMILARMKEDMDPFYEISTGSFAGINEWMSEHVFRHANILSPKEWILEICGKPLCADDYLDYVNKKYRAIYDLDEHNEMVKQIRAYAARTERIRKLSSPGLSQLKTPDDYLTLLSNNFIKIGELSRQNKVFIKEYIVPILESEGTLSDETIEKINVFYHSLISQDSTKTLDIPIVLRLSERMLEDAALKGDDAYYISQLDRQLDNAYHMVNQTQRITACPEIAYQFRLKGLHTIEEISKYLDKDKFLSLDEYSRKLVIGDMRFGAALYEYSYHATDSVEGIKARLEMIERAIALYDDEFYRNTLPEEFWQMHLFRCYEMILTSGPVETGSELAKYMLENLGCLEDLIRKHPDNLVNLAPAEYLEVLFGYVRYKGGAVSQTDYLARMLETWDNADENCHEDRYSIVANVTSAVSYIEAASSGTLTEEIRSNISSMYRNMISYAFHMPKLGDFTSDMAVFSDIISGFVEIPGGITFMQMGLNLLAALHPTTYIHSVMVAKIGGSLTRHLIKCHPELFVGCRGCETREDVTLHQDEFHSFVYNAGLCHDFGKLIIIDTIYVYGRPLLEVEQDIIRSHAAMGAALLARHDSTREYVNVAAGHHRWYDGTHGYPETFDIINSPCRTATSIVCCADCMDTATDKIGRSYNEGISLEDYIREVTDGAGTRYAPYMAELLQRPEVVEDIRFLLSEGRQKVYRDTYRLLSMI